jgi:4-hydroxy-3-methylbut-2-enyl diphosphate reductase
MSRPVGLVERAEGDLSAMPPSGPPGGGAALLLFAPLRIEAFLARRGAPTATVLRTGMGADRSRTAVDRLGVPTDVAAWSVAAVLGFCGGLSAGQRPGDVVVASELRVVGEPDGRAPLSLTSADAVADAMRAEGLRVSVGPLVSLPKVVRGDAARRRMAESGAIGADMESWWLATALGQLHAGGAADACPHRAVANLAVVRVISDAPGHGIVSLRTAQGLPAACRAMRSCARALELWATSEPTTKVEDQ